MRDVSARQTPPDEESIQPFGLNSGVLVRPAMRPVAIVEPTLSQFFLLLLFAYILMKTPLKFVGLSVVSSVPTLPTRTTHFRI
jgi:hypothetical protein